MKRFHLVAAIGVLLSGCAHFPGVPSLEERSRPQVSVDGKGMIQVTPPVLYFFPGERDVEIVWQLPKDSKYRFPVDAKSPKDQGILIEGRLSDRASKDAEGNVQSVFLERKPDEIGKCEVRRSGLEFACLNRHTEPGIYKYTIRLRDGSKDVVRDPPIVNM